MSRSSPKNHLYQITVSLRLNQKPWHPQPWGSGTMCKRALLAIKLTSRRAESSPRDPSL